MAPYAYFQRKNKQHVPAEPAVINMTKVIARANQAKGPQPDLSRVEAAVKRLDTCKPAPAAPPVSHAGRVAEDAARRGYLNRPSLVRACCGFHHSDFHNNG